MRTRDTDKEQLVKQKAIEMLVKDGLDGFSMNKLAKACDISVATLYIYYKDKDDLIIRISTEEAERMIATMLKDFDPDASFEEGLRQQWKNRAKQILDNPMSTQLFELLRSTPYKEGIHSTFMEGFKETMGRFMHNAIKRGEIDPLPFEVFWSVAYGPLYNLLRFHTEGRSVGNRKFTLTKKTMWETFDLVVKALKK